MCLLAICMSSLEKMFRFSTYFLIGLFGFFILTCMSSSCMALEQPWGDTPHRRAKEEPQQDGWRGEFMFRIKPHSCQRCSEGSNKLMHTRTQEKGGVTPQETDPDLLWVSRSLWRRRGSAVACCRAGGPECSSACMGPSEGGHHYLLYLHCSLASGQIMGRNTSQLKRKLD